MDTASTSKPQDSAVPGADWPATITAEFATNEYNPRVGTRLLSTSDRVAGQTKHVFSPGKYKVHDLQNIGSTELIFTTVEFLQSANSLLPLAETAAGTA